MNEDFDSSVESKTLGRFEKVLRTYWDGVPTPLFVAETSVNSTHITFALRLLGYSPDYHGETTEVSFSPVSSSEFRALSSLSCESSPSTRIGNHYSPYAGTFSFVQRKGKKSDWVGPGIDSLTTNNARIPLESCDHFSAPDKLTPYREFLRMEKVVELYEPLVREYFPFPRESLRRIIIAATLGIALESKEWIVSEVAVLTDEWARWMSQSIYYYMCMSPLFRRVLKPLEARTEPDRPPHKMLILDKHDRAAARASSQSARHNLLASLRWGKNTTGLFTALKILWDTRFAPLAFFNLTLDQTFTDAEDFVSQLTDSMRAAFTRLRLEFYAQAEDFFFTYIPDSKKTLFLNEDEVRSSHFNTVFTAMRIFLQNNLRVSLLQGFGELLRFFDCDGLKGARTTERIALKHPLLKVDLIVGENYLPRSPQFSRLAMGLLELFDRAMDYSNNLPQLDTALLRTLKLENRAMCVLCEDDVAQLKSSLSSILSEITESVDEISTAFSAYSSLPVQELSTSFLSSAEAIEHYAMELRESYNGVRRASPDRVFCGCVVIDCSAVKEEYCANWERTLNAFYARLYSMVRQAIGDAEEKVTSALQKVEKPPSSVKELEIFLSNIEDAATLAQSLREKECHEVVKAFECMERAQIPIDPELYEQALKLMRFPTALDAVVGKAGSARADCRPLLLEKLKQLRKETRDNMQTLSTGITELYNMFNFEICDIAAQTCSELRELVEQVNATVKSVFYQEDALNVKTVDTFEDLDALLTAFETIEQYWGSIYRSTTLREYYNSPVRNIDADKMIESVREWRRQIHAATRQVRAYPALVRLGKQQELALAKFEELEALLRVITTPGLKKTHWKEIVRFIAANLKDDTTLAINMSLPLQKLIDAGIANYLADITRIAAQARNDYDVENTLETMKSVAKKTHFQVIDWDVGFMTRRRVSPESFKRILSMIEDFVAQCHAMRQKSGVSSLVVGMLAEWEAATEKARDIVLIWLQVEDQWDLMFPLFKNLSAAKEKDMGSVWPAVEAKLCNAKEAFLSLYTMVSKPQFSLYTAVVQESISDFLLSAKNTMLDVSKMVTDALEQRRNAYPRFHFLTDSQLMTFLSPNNIDSLERLLPFMFSNLCGVCVEDGAIVAFVTNNGAYLEAVQPVPITAEPVEKWMQNFEETLRTSLLTSVKLCLSAKMTAEVSVWTSQFCAQTVELALRIDHTQGMRDALRVCGEDGLTAHRAQLKDLLDECIRLSHKPELPTSQTVVVAASVIYLKHAVSEVEHAIANHVATVADVDVTSMLQTFLAEDTIYIRFLGITCVYGFEFTGNPVHPMMAAVVETSLDVMTQVWLGRTAPVLSGLLKKESVLAFIAAFLGRFVLSVQGNSSLTTAAARPLLRGCMQQGALLCIHACEALSHDLFVLLRECSEKVGNALLLEKPDPSTTVPVGPGGSTVSLSLSTHYGLVFCTNDYGSVPRSLSFYFRPIYVPPLRTVEMVRAYLDVFGLAETPEATCQAFAALYDHFSEVDPSTFSHRNFVMLLVHACSHGVSGTPLERLCSAFVHIFYSFLRKDPHLRSLLEWHLRHTLQTDGSDLLQRLPAMLSDKPHDATARFDALMTSCRNVVLVGPPFSGKSTLWRRYVGDSRYVAFCPGLLSVGEFYGTAERPGLLTTIAKRPPLKSGEREFIIMTETNISQCDWWLTWPSDSRVLSAETNYLVGSTTHLVVTTQTVEHMTPNVACDFVVFYLPPTTDWQRFLHRSLRGAPHADVALKLISTLLPLVCAALQERVEGVSLNLQDASFLATCQHCANLYRRWHAHTTKETIVEAYFDDLLADPRLFAAQCATFAVCWNVGLGLPPREQVHLKAALRDAEAAVAEAMLSVNVPDHVLPPLGEQDPSILHLLCTPRGWKTFDEAVRCGFDFRWTAFSQMSSSHSANSPIFAAPSRQPTLTALQCLVDCGQNVVLTGLEGSGKSTLLSLTRLRDCWVSLPVSANRGFSAVSVQRGIADRLYLRSDGRYGPQPGRRLVVCIDDIHLCPLVAPATSAASQLIAYCSSLGAICDPDEGFAPVTDVGFFATMTQSNPTHLTAPVRFCTNVYLPPFDPDELASGLWKLFDAACQKKRVAEMPRACSSFLVCAHAAFLRALGQPPPPPSAPDSAGGINSSAASSTMSRDSSAASSHLLDQFATAVENFLPQRFADVLAAADAVRHHLLSSASDVAVALNIVTATADMYATTLRRRHRDTTPQLVGDLAVSAAQSFAEVLRTTPAILKANLDGATQDHEEQLPSKEESNKVAEWIAEFELPGNALAETRLDAMYTRTPPLSAFSGLARVEDDPVSTLLFVRSAVASTGNDGGSQNTSRSGSVIHSTSGRTGSASGAGGGGGRMSVSRRGSTTHRGSASRRGSLTRRASSRSLRGSLQLDAGSINQSFSVLLSPTVQTAWLTRQLLTLTRELQHSESHVALVGSSKFGYRRLLRIFCHHTHLPLTMLQKAAGYDVSQFMQDMKTVITFACQNDSRTLIYLPQSILRLSGVARIVDGVIANGDISEFFSKEERLAVHRGFTVNNTKSLRTLTLAEDAELRRRVRRGISFILQVESTAIIEELTEGYPAFNHVSVVNTGSVSHWKRSEEELVSAGLYGDDVDPAIVDEPLDTELRRYGSQLKLRGQPLIQLLCAIYHTVAEDYPVVMEQLTAFAQQVRRFRMVELVEIQRANFTTRAISTRGDTATVEMNNCLEQRKSAVKECTDTQNQSKKLKTRLVKEEEANETFQKSAKEAEQQVREEEAQLHQEEAVIKEAQESADDAVAAAAGRLRRMKGAHLRSMKSMRLPEKGLLLIRSVYKILGQELPKHNGPTDLWFAAANVMSESSFVNTVAALDPNRVTDVAPLMSTLREIGEVRYGKVFPYGQLLADFVAAYIESARTRLIVNAPLLEKLTEERAAFEEMRADVEGLYSKAKDVLETASSTQETIVQLEARVASLTRLQGSLDQRVKRLSHYVGAVDRLSSFLSKGEMTDKSAWAATAEGDCILLAAFTTLLAAHHHPMGILPRLQALLDKHSLSYSTNAERPFTSFLTAGNPDHMNYFMSLGSFPRRQQLALGLLFRQATATWCLLGGVCPTFERRLVEAMRLQSRGCTVLSAFEGYLSDRLTQCMRDGEAVLLRDVFSTAGLALMHQLEPLRLKLRAWREALARERAQKQQQQQQQQHGSREGKTARMPFRIFGRDVEVHPDFFVVATCSAPLPVRASDATTSLPTPTKWLTVFNFYVPVARAARYDQLLFRMPASKNVAEELQDIRARLYHEMVEYKVKYDDAAAVVALPLEQLASNGDEAIDALESTLLDFEFHFNQITQLRTQAQNVWKRQRDDWGALAAPLSALADVVGFLERDKMGRTWGDNVLDSFIRYMPHLSPELVSRLAPQRFDDLAKEQQRFYALFNCLQSVVQCYACGWSRPLRGLYGLIVLSTVALASDDIAKQRGIAYSQTVEFLTAAQLEALRAILAVDGARSPLLFEKVDATENENAIALALADARTNAILCIYEASHDDLLVRIAKSERDSLGGDSLHDEMSGLLPVNSPGTPAPFMSQFVEDVSLCADLFRALVSLDVKTAENIALALCVTFTHSVLDSRTLSAAETVTATHTDHGVSGDGSSRSHGRQKSTASVSVLRTTRRRGNSVAASSVAAESVGGGGVRGDLLEMAAQGDVKVHSHAQLTEFCTREAVAVFIATNHLAEVVKDLRHRAADAQLAHHWHTVTTVADLTATSAAMMGYFQSREMTKKGHWAIMELAAPDLASNAEKLKEFSEALHHTLVVYHSRSVHGLLGGEVDPVIPVRLTVVCDHAMWAMLSLTAASAEEVVSGTPEVETQSMPCLMIARGFVTPRYHLLSLLEKDEIQRGCELNTNKRRFVEPEDETRPSLRKPPTAREQDTEQLERLCVLLFKELTLLHVSVAEHTRYLRSEWRSVGAALSRKLEPSLDVEGDDDNLVTFLRIVRGWARRVNRADGDAWVCDGDRSAAPTTMSSLTSLNRRHLEAISAVRGGGDAVTNGGPRHAHRHAFNLYRQRRLAWQLMTAEGRESQVTNVFRDAFMEEERVTRPSRRLPSQGELMKRHCIHSVYLLFQKIAYLFVARLGERVSEHMSVLHIIRHRICGPSPEHTAVFLNVDQLLQGSSGLTADKLNLNTEPQLLRLDAETTLAEFRTEVARLHSQLLGLCQYPAAVGHYEARCKSLTESLFFGVAPAPSSVLTPMQHTTVVVATPPSAYLTVPASDTGVDAVAAAESELAALLPPLPDPAAPAPSTRTSNSTIIAEERLGWTLEKNHLARLYAAVQRLAEDTPAAEDTEMTVLSTSATGGADIAPLPMNKDSRDRVVLHMLNTCHALNGTADALPSMWLPCLRYPSLSFFFTAFYARAAFMRRHESPEEVEKDEAVPARGAILVITQRALLRDGDVLLVGARLSPLLQTEVQQLTQWPSTYFDATDSTEADAATVVVAARVLHGEGGDDEDVSDATGGRPSLGVSGVEQRLLWGVTPPTQRAADVLGGTDHSAATSSPSLTSGRPATARPGHGAEPAASVFVTEVNLNEPTATTAHSPARTQAVRTMTSAPISVYTKTLVLSSTPQTDGPTPEMDASPVATPEANSSEETVQQQWHCASAEVYGMLEYIPTTLDRLTETAHADNDDNATQVSRRTARFSPHGGSAHFVYIE